MKKLADFKKDLNESKTGDENYLSVDLSESNIKEPPATLLMRRKAIRMYPDGKRVVLYYIDKLNRYISIPYDEAFGMNFKDIPVSEEVLAEGSVVRTLRRIVKNGQADTVQFSDGGTMTVDVPTAKSILNVHGAVNDANRKKVETMINKDKLNFGKIAAFSHGAHVS